MPSPEAEAALKAGDLTAAIAATKASIRKAPVDPDLRLLLFQVLAAKGDWDAARNQAKALAELTGGQSPAGVVYEAILAAEIERAEVFAGARPPTVLGEPPVWLPLQVQAAQHAARGEWAAAAGCQEKMREAADPVSGTLNGKPFEWLMDADSRIGLVIEGIANGVYYWIPQSRIITLEIAVPETLRDLLWARASASLTNGGTVQLFLPVRYPLNNATPDSARLSRTTAWEEPVDGFLAGAGPRIWTTSNDEDAPILETLRITFDNPLEAPPAGEAPGE